MLLLHKFILTVLVAVMLPLSGSARIDTRKVALDITNLKAGWQFYSKSASKATTSRQFRSPVGDQIYVYARQFKTPAAAMTEYRKMYSNHVAGDEVYPRPAPLRRVDAYYLSAGLYDVWVYERWTSVVGDTLLIFSVYSEYTPTTDAQMLACEALQIDRIKRPAAAGICPIEAIQDIPEGW